MSKQFYPPAGFHFKIFIENFQQDGIDTAFQEVSGISMNLEVKPLKEGGVNFMSPQLPGRTTYENLELKRGLVPLNSRLASWCFSSFGNKATGKIGTKVITLQLLNEESKPLMVWTFHDAYPIKWNVSGFNAQQSGIVVESMTFAYSFFETEMKLETQEVNAVSEDEEGEAMSNLFG